MKHFISIFIAITILSFISCNKKTKDAEEEIDSNALAIAVLPTYECIPFYYAEKEGIFDSLGVDVRLITFKSSMDADTAFINGEAVGAVTDIVKASLWKAKGKHVKVVMAMDPNLSLVTSNTARLFQLSSIKERIVAITRHSIVDFTTDKILASANMKSIDLNKPQINDIVLRTGMTDQNQYDGAVLPEPYTTEATKLYGGKLLTSSQKLGLHYMATLVVNDSTIRSHTKDISKIITAYSIAVERLNKQQQCPLKYLPQDKTVAVPDTLFEYQTIATPDMPSTTLFDDVNNWLKGRGLIKTSASYGSLFDSSFIKK